MAPTLQQFVEQLVASKLMSADELKEFMQSFPRQVRPKSADELGKELVRFNKLTRYQASRVYRNKLQGLVLGNNIIERKIGRGGMGDVYQARHRLMKRQVAIKILSPSVTKRRRALIRFAREVETAAKLSHPNIVTAYDADESEGLHYLVMEFVDGIDLAQYVDKHGPLTVPQAIHCMIQAAKGLAYAHSEGVIHRDIKPHNMLIDGDGNVKILDMGLVLLGQEDIADDEMTNHNQIVGTVDYMSPEQAEDTRQVDHRTDIYAMGCCFHRILIGKPPFSGETPVQKLLAHREQPAPSLMAARDDVPEELEAIYLKMMAKDANDRYDTVPQLIAEMEKCLERIKTGAEKEVVTAGVVEADSDMVRFVASIAPEPALEIDPHDSHISKEVTFDRHSGQSTISDSQPLYARRRGPGAGLYVIFGGVFISLILTLTLLAWWWSQPTQIVIPWELADRLDARLVIDGRTEQVGRDNPLVIPLTQGTHTVIIERDGYRTQRHVVTLKHGRTVTIPTSFKERQD